MRRRATLATAVPHGAVKQAAGGRVVRRTSKTVVESIAPRCENTHVYFDHGQAKLLASAARIDLDFAACRFNRERFTQRPVGGLPHVHADSSFRDNGVRGPHRASPRQRIHRLLLVRPRWKPLCELSERVAVTCGKRLPRETLGLRGDAADTNFTAKVRESRLQTG